MASTFGAQYQNTLGNTIYNQSNVKFDTAIETNADIIYYPDNGQFGVRNEWFYYIMWWVSTQACETTTTAFAIKINDKIITSNSPSTKNQLSGTALFQVSNPNDEIALKNISGATVKFGIDTPIKANILIIKGADTELENLVDGNNEGAVNGINSMPDYTMGINSIAVGQDTVASGYNAFSQGLETIASGDNSHAQGNQSEASGQNAHAEGF